MKLFQRVAKQHPVAQGFAPKASPEIQASFILEPILTPSAGIDGTEGTPDLAIAQLTTLPNIDLPELNFELDATNSPEVDTALDFDGNLEPVDFIDGLDAIEIGENSWFESGVFTVGVTGEVSIDFLFDGGGYQGELAIFSLDGMEKLEPGSETFIQEAARRALSSSDLGYVVVSDTTDAAKFSGSFGWEGNFNSGDYQGVKTFQMRPSDRLGFMLVPNNTVQAVFENPCDDGIRPLFSMATANPDDHFQTGQIADVTGDGNTFVFEDLRLDGNSDRDYNDVVFQVPGATGNAAHLDDVIDSGKDWRTSDLGNALIAYAEPYIGSDPDHDLHNHDHSSEAEADLTESLEIITPISEPDGYDFAKTDQPLIGVIDTGVNGNNPFLNYNQIISGYDWVGADNDSRLQFLEGNEHGTHVVGTISSLNDDAPIWVGRAVGSGQWANSLIEFVDAAKASGQPNAVANLSFELAQLNADESLSTRFELTRPEWEALEYAHRNNVIVVAAAGNDSGAISALGQAANLFDNIITVGSAQQVDASQSITTGFDRASYSNFGTTLSLVANGGTPDNPILAPVEEGMGTMSGTSVATAKVTGVISQVWAANPALSYQQVIDILKTTAVDLNTPNWDVETGAGLVNLTAAVYLAKATIPLTALPKAPLEPEFWADVETAMERAVNVTEVNFSGTVISTVIALQSRVRTYDRAIESTEQPLCLPPIVMTFDKKRLPQCNEESAKPM